MIKAVFFDWFNTLARYDPPREELYRQAFKDFGIDVNPSAIYQGLQAADNYFLQPANKDLLRGGSLGDRAMQFVRYPQAICKVAGIEVPQDAQVKIIQKVLGGFRSTFILFDDVLPVLRELKQKGLIIGLITNADRNVIEVAGNLGVSPLLDVLITSEQTGFEKPAAPIFIAAMDQAHVKPEESVYVGDQYSTDIVGSRGAGMRPVLLDRYDYNPEISDCLKIPNLTMLEPYL